MYKLLLLLFLYIESAQAMNIVTIDNDPHQCLTSKAEEIPLTKEGLAEAKKIADEMIKTITPLMPAAGLAAPQIGVSKQVFIYSWNRSLDTMEVAINPSFESVDNKTQTKWEACFSTILGNPPYRIAHLPRYTKILATYTTLEGKTKKVILEEFGAKVFQHEWDHLQGVENTSRKDAEVKEFMSKEELTEFTSQVKLKDKVDYLPPKIME